MKFESFLQNNKEKYPLGEWQKDERGNYYKLTDKGGKITLTPEEWEEHNETQKRHRIILKEQAEKARKESIEMLEKERQKEAA